ncbi:transcriptional regulator with XRE-family HTH domain [Nocardiopsis arvandica]|uniref:Transcriptional regulator with XRE-family HTH domain n=1 Tax=Nocardiopsis sinuspersici TaxID=501010 RepID=A0A7Z0BJF3_9ACTN|nr:helix-turn-helix transcriptional regulator [Nocardiopsis sinuspersici]NYH53056.1 transcriptional regulator with XRE-family HTH domain [Nocardiopsis sinuspersici]
MVDRGELAAFLRDRRARIGTGDVGLPDTGRRRTPGLRRQEVAQLAGMSVEYYVRLEQARGPHPSRQVLSALSRALMLDTDERAYLFRLAGAEPPVTRRPSREVTTAVRHLLDGLATTPAYVLDAKYDVLAWNRMATHFIGDMTALPADRRNIIEWMFSQPDDDPHWDDPNAECFTHYSVADLRTAYARYPGDPGIARLVTTLLGTSPRFTRMWESREVRSRRGFTKRVEHPLVGTLVFECQVLYVPDTDQRVMMYVPEPESPTERALARLAAESPAPEPHWGPPPPGPMPRGPDGVAEVPPPAMEHDGR